MTDTKIILHNIRSSLNVGSIFRTADGAGVGQIYLTGYTPTPIDRFGREEKMIAKTALGAEKSIFWEQGDVTEIIKSLKDDGYSVVAVEQVPDSKDYKSFKPKEKTVFVFGNEVGGIEKEVIELCDYVIEIKMHGEKESLNVGVAVGVILFNYKN
jgi:tRNA G18 (ribose-2'-O)-methylase SpoU